MAKPLNYKAGACQNSRVTNICYRKTKHEQINFILDYLLLHFLRSMSTLKVASKLQNSLIAPSNMYFVAFNTLREAS